MDLIEKIATISRFLSPSRISRFLKNIKNRTDFITIVIDDIYQPHNASAVLRTCDAFGLSDVYVIEGSNKFTPVKGISQSAEKWLCIKRFKDRQECYNELITNGYKICIATPPNEDSIYLDDFEIDDKIAIVIGSEMEGVSEFFREKADYFLSIKMYGFVESFNLSVACAIILYEMRKKLEKSNINWHISPIKKGKILWDWMRGSVYFADKLFQKDN